MSAKSRSRIVTYLYERYEDPEDAEPGGEASSDDEDIFSE